ncbi:MAG: hypothetical protein KC621_19445, partial [Myxococcales bacterium]|nr:hypothetical protein [Myxococcales bacterium]
MLLLWLAAAGAAPTPSDATRGELEQVVLPSLDARRASAEARAAALSGVFDGSRTLADAWPLRTQLDLFDRAVLAGLQRELDASARSREAERALSPALDDPDLLERHRATLAATLDAEEAAGRLDSRLIASRQAFLDRAPGLATAAWRDSLDRWQRALDAATAEGATEDAVAAGDAALAARSRLEDIRSAAWRGWLLAD